MNKKVIFGAFGLAASSLFAVDGGSFNPYVGVKGGLSVLSKRDGVKYKAGFDGGIEFGVSYDCWRLGLELAYRTNKIKDDKTSNANIKGEFEKVNTLAGLINAYYDYAVTDDCVIYAGVGLGVAKTSFKANVSGIEESKTVFAWQLTLGVAYYINECWTVEAFYRLFNTSKARVSNATGNSKADIKASFGNTFGLGVRYNF